MLTKEECDKIRNCKELKGKTIADVCQSDNFLKNLREYIRVQREERITARSLIQKGMRLQAHPIDKIMERGLMDDGGATRFANEYCRILNRVSTLPANEREYILQLGAQAYNLTVVQAVTKQYPELKDKLSNNKRAN